MNPKCPPGGSKIASGGVLGANPKSQPKTVTFFAPFVPLLGGSWGAPGALLGARGAVLGRSLDVLERSWGSFWAPGALLLELFWSPWRAGLHFHENIENHWFSSGFQGFSGFGAPRIVPKSSQHRSEEALGHQVGPKRVPKVTREALETLWMASGRPGKRVGRPTRRTSFPEPGSAGLGPDSRGGVGEVF